MTFPLMPFSAQAPYLTDAQAAAYTYTNYIDLMTPGERVSGSSSNFAVRTARAERLSKEYTSSLGTFANVAAPRPVSLTNGCTILFFGGRDSSSSAGISGAEVNGSAISITALYNVAGTTAGNVYMSCYIGYTPLQVQDINSVNANFPVGGGTDILNSGSIYILPGRWAASSVTAFGAGVTGTLAIAANEIVGYSSATNTDTSSANVTYTAGTLIGCSKVNWYDGVEHGLVYRTSSGSVTLDQAFADAYLRMFKLTYQD